MSTFSEHTAVEEERPLVGWLVISAGPLKGRDYRLHEGRNVVGSGHYVDIFIPTGDIEPFHFSVRTGKEQWQLTDLDSHTGIYINGKRVFRETIEDECAFSIPGIEFLVKRL